jgi:drug/metabolite transporter (DMT)-like permease
VIAVLLALASSLCWGTSDFLGGLQSRRIPAFSVVLWSQLAGGTFLLLITAIVRPELAAGSIVWGSAAGMVGAIALVLFYRGLATGLMSIVAPVSACGVIVPVLFSIASGQVPHTLTMAGIVAAILGIVLVSMHTAPHGGDVVHSRGAIVLALGAAAGFGLFFVFINAGTAAPHGTPLWTVVGARLGSAIILPALVLTRRTSAPWPGRRLPVIALVGLLDSGANLLFATATTHGVLAVVSVLGALYPVATVVLGQIVLRERLGAVQGAGVVLALSGVVLLSST